jgi:hypothetical protein
MVEIIAEFWGAGLFVADVLFGLWAAALFRANK